MINATVPDTITSWYASAFAMSKNSGLGVASPSSLTVFQPFFVSLTLPYSVIRGEELTVITTVFNYMSSCMTVSHVCPIHPLTVFSPAFLCFPHPPLLSQSLGGADCNHYSVQLIEQLYDKKSCLRNPSPDSHSGQPFFVSLPLPYSVIRGE